MTTALRTGEHVNSSPISYHCGATRPQATYHWFTAADFATKRGERITLWIGRICVTSAALGAVGTHTAESCALLTALTQVFQRGDHWARCTQLDLARDLASSRFWHHLATETPWPASVRTPMIFTVSATASVVEHHRSPAAMAALGALLNCIFRIHSLLGHSLFEKLQPTQTQRGLA